MPYHRRVHLSRGRFDAFGVGASLTLAFGMLSHLAVEAIVTTDRLELLTRSHGIMALVAIAALAWSIGRIAGTGSSRERRRRIALVRARLRVETRGFVAAVSLAQAAIAAGILRFEDIHIAPGQMLAAVVSGVIAVAAGTFALRLARRRIIIVLASWATARAQGPAFVHTGLLFVAPRTSASIPFLRARPDRAPPHVLIA
jgi:hypothetical protein